MNFENLQITVSELPKAEDMKFTHLHKDYKSTRLIVVILFTVALLIGGVCVLAFTGNLLNLTAWTLAITVPFVYLLLAIIFVYKSYVPKGYVVRQRDIAYRSGWIFHSITVIPYNRIQHCEVSQGPIEKMFDLCRIMIYTAGGSYSEVEIPGLLYSEGETLRDHLLNQVTQNAAN